jgi:hypothetical protein
MCGGLNVLSFIVILPYIFINHIKKSLLYVTEPVRLTISYETHDSLVTNRR